VNNATLLTADRGTHAKIVVVALVASIAVCLVGIRAHVKISEPPHQGETSLVTAGGWYTANENPANPD
jgi:hypothetical protein